MKMPFGKHKGKPLEEIPVDYLRWLYYEADIRDDLYEAVADELENRAEEELHGITDYK